MPRHSPRRPVVIGFGWFTREQWQRLIEVVEDRNELDDTYEQWEKSAVAAMQMIERQGHKVERVYIEVEALVSWCKRKGLTVNGKSRAEYVTQLMGERDGQTKA
jgi:hypothetical protein